VVNARNLLMDKVIARVGQLPNPIVMDEELLKLKQLYALAFASFQAAECAEHQAFKAKTAARKLECELRVRIELLEEKLGMRQLLTSESDSLTPDEEHA
jgi:hypothetical protein